MIKTLVVLLLSAVVPLLGYPAHEFFPESCIFISNDGIYVYFDEYTVKCEAITYMGYGFYRMCDPDFGKCSECGKKLVRPEYCSNPECPYYNQR